MKKKREKRGPEPENLKIDEDNWKNAVKKAITKKKPKDGWPSRTKKTDSLVIDVSFILTL